MKVFEAYANYYDLLYKDKNYKGEAEYINNLIKSYSPEAISILNFGCGTGSHDFILSELGFDITAVDLSAEMIAEANRRKEIGKFENIDFIQGDLRDITIPKKFDVVVSLFHVISYQTTNSDLIAAFHNIKKHLKPGGIIIFDCWYGPAVLSDKPAVRTKYLTNDKIEITRIAEPQFYENDNLVDVNYHLFIKDKSDNTYSEIKEQHKMRYLFKPEIELLVSEVDLQLIHSEEWLTGLTPGFNTWGVCFILKN